MTDRERLEKLIQEHVNFKMDNRITAPTKTTKTTEPLAQFIVKKVKGQRRKVGVIVACPTTDPYTNFPKVRLGWSRTNFSKGDVFNKKVAMDIAIGRTKSDQIVPICHSFKKDAIRFRERCTRYYKGGLVDPVLVAPRPRIPRISTKSELQNKSVIDTVLDTINVVTQELCEKCISK